MNKNCLLFEAYPFFSGSQRISLNVCKILKEQGYTVTLLLADDRFGSLKHNFEKYVDEIVYIKVSATLLKYGDEDSWFARKTFFKSVFFGIVPLYFRATKFILKSKYNYLYCCDPRGAMMMLLPALLFKGTTILHFHGKNRLPPILAKIFIRIFDTIICVSKDVSNSLPASQKKKVIYNGIDYSQYGTELDVVKVTTEAEELTGIQSNQMVKFLFAGLLRPHKGVHHLIYAFAQLVKVHTSEIKPVLFLCGAAKTTSEEIFRDQLINYCREQNIENNIYWLGWKSNPLEWMNYADYFVFPTIDKEENVFDGFGHIIESTEGLPTVLIESSICHLYNIAADVTGVKEIISTGTNGILLDKKNKDSLYKALNLAFTTRPKFLGFPNREEFSIKTFKDQITFIFNN